MRTKNHTFKIYLHVRALFSWILQIVTWFGITYLAYYGINFRELSRYYKTENSNELSSFEMFAIISGMTYFAYIICMCNSITFYYLQNLKDGNKIYDTMGTLFRTAPLITFHACCYHYEKQSRKMSELYSS